MKTHLLTILFTALIFNVSSQETETNDTLRRIATIEHSMEENLVKFTPKTPPLNQIAGAPKAFYNYFWEFGDGDYSKEETPSKGYNKEGEYEIKLWATNVYDTGKPPTSKPKKIKVSEVDETAGDQASMTEDLSLIRNREPIPDEELVIVMRYKNAKDYATNGSLYLFYNEQKYKADNFELADTRTYHGEIKVNKENLVFNHNISDNTGFYASVESNPTIIRTHFQDSTEQENIELTLAKAKSMYKASSVLKFENMKPNEERNIFYTLKTTPEMLKDTSAIISVRSVYIPDSNYTTHKVKDMEMEIVTSHDPNKMSSNSTFINYRIVRAIRPEYKIKFQNNGEGPARTIRLETDIPDMYDKTTISVEDLYPEVRICPKTEVQYSCLDTTYTEKQAIFTFKNIYLPGSEQENVKDYDSTKGFVKYSLKFGKDFHKQKTKSQTAIIFDKNDPIITNYATTRFLPGLSVGVKVGYNAFGDLKDSKSYFVGATFSPYKSYRWYWQVELLNSFHQYSGNTIITEGFAPSPAGNQVYQRTTVTNTFDNIDWEIPLLIRYNVNNYIGLGTGLQGMLSLSEKEARTTKVEQFESINMQPEFMLSSDKTTNESNNSFTNFRTGFLIEVTAGFSRIGPSLGARYVINFKEDFNYLQLYALWKF